MNDYFLPYSPNASQTPREAGVSCPVMMWYDLLLFASTLLWCYVLMHFVMFCYLFFFSFCRWRYLPPTTGGTLVEKVIAAPSAVTSGVEEEPPSGGMTKEVGQPMQSVQPILPSAPLAA